MWIPPSTSPIAGIPEFTTTVVFVTFAPGAGAANAAWHQRSHMVSVDGCPYCDDHGLSVGGGGYVAGGIGLPPGPDVEFKAEQAPINSYQINDGAIHVVSFSNNLDDGTDSTFLFKLDELPVATDTRASYTSVANTYLNTTFGDHAFISPSGSNCFGGGLVDIRFDDTALGEEDLANLHASILDSYPSPRLQLSLPNPMPRAGETIDLPVQIVNVGSPYTTLFGTYSAQSGLSRADTGFYTASDQTVSGGVANQLNTVSGPQAGDYVYNTTVTSTSGVYIRNRTASISITIGLNPATFPMTGPENQPNTFILDGAAPTGACTLLSTTCVEDDGQVVTIERASASSFQLVIPVQNHETTPTCSVTLIHDTMTRAQTLDVTISNGNDLPVASNMDFVYRTVEEYGTGLIPLTLPGTDEDAADTPVFRITQLPSVVALALPGTTTALEEDDLPVTLPGTNGAVSLFLKRGIFNDSFSWEIQTGADIATGQIGVSMSVPCTLGRAPENLDGTCICPSGTFVNITDGCQACAVGTFYTGEAIANPCDPCVFGGFCPGGVDPPVPDDGFGYAGGDRNSSVFVRCRPPQVCVRGGFCRQGSVGVLCKDCLPGHYKEAGLCKECPSTAPILLALLFVLMVALAVVLVKLARKSAAYYVALSVGFNFLQVLSVVAQFDLKWPGFVKTTFDLLSVFTFQVNIFAPECAMAGGAIEYFPIWLFKLSIPLLFAVMFALFHVVLEIYKRIRARISEVQHPFLARAPLVTRATTVLLRNATLNAYVSILVMTYLVVVSVTFEAFDCVNGAMVKAPDVVCGSPEWRKFLGVALVSMVVYGIGIPALFASLIWWHRLSLFSELTIVRLGLLYRRYRPGHHYFELAILGRKLGIVIGILFFNSVVPQACVALAALLIGLGVQMITQPFITSRVNRLESIGVACSAVIVLCGLILYGTAESGSKGVTTFVGVVVVIIIVVNVLFIGLVVGLEARYQYRRISRGVQSGFASDEVMLDERFFKLGFRVRAHERNIMGTVSALSLSSDPHVSLRVELCDGGGRIMSDFDGRSDSIVQSDGELHMILSTFARVGRYQLRVFAWRDDEAKYLAHNASGPGQTDSRTLYDRITCQTKSTVAVPVLAYHMNCDVPPQAVVSFAAKSPRMVEEQGIVIRPRFRELSRFIPHEFEIRAPATVGLLVCRDQPVVLTDGVELSREMDDLGVFVGQVSFTDPGPMRVWGQYLAEGHDPPYVFHQLVEFEVLEGRAGWEDIDRENNSRIIDRLCEASGVEMHAVLEADLSTTDPPDVSDEFTSRRGLLYLPKTRSVPFGDGMIHLQLRLPSAVDIRLATRIPAVSSDGHPFFKREDGVFVADADWATLGVEGPGVEVSVYASFADVANYALEGGPKPSAAGLGLLGDDRVGRGGRATSSAMFGSSKPTISGFQRMITFVVR